MTQKNKKIVFATNQRPLIHIRSFLIKKVNIKFLSSHITCNHSRVVKESIAGGEAVWFGCEVSKRFERKNGLEDLDA